MANIREKSPLEPGSRPGSARRLRLGVN
jgi:hypothetical protein